MKLADMTNKEKEYYYKRIEFWKGPGVDRWTAIQAARADVYLKRKS